MTKKKLKETLDGVEYYKKRIIFLKKRLWSEVELYKRDFEVLKNAKEIYLSICRLSWNKCDVGIVWKPAYDLYQSCKKNVNEDRMSIKSTKHLIKVSQRWVSKLYLSLK